MGFKDIKKYVSPKNDNIAVCMVFFNPANYTKTILNNLYVQNILKNSNIPYFIMELVYEGKEQTFPDDTNIFHVKTNSYMFHKENLFNLLIERIPKKYDKIVCLDGDVIFENDNWINILDEKLNNYDIVMPYHDGILLSSSYQNIDSTGVTILDTRYNDRQKKLLAGYAISFNRDFFEKVGFYEYAILGGGDKMLFRDFIDWELKINPFNSTKKQDYLDKVKSMKFTYSYISGIVFHLYHGTTENRKYLERHSLLTDLNIDTDLVKNDDGVLEFISPNKYNNVVLGYFKSRNEDV